MSVFDGNESWLVQRRSGEIDDEFISITEQITIINNRGQFTEVPNDFNGVVIKSADNLITYSSKDSGIPTANVFIINYNQGIITADSIFNNVAINVSYKGTGKFLLSSERVYTKQENGIVLETLQEIVDNANPILESEEARNDAEIIRQSQEENRQNTYSSGHIKFKGVVTGKTSLPSSSNILGDTYQVINDATTSNNAMWRYDGTVFEKAYVLDLTFAGGYGANDSQVFTATANQTLFTLTNFPYLIGVNQLLVMISGIKQTIPAYTETSTNSFTLSEGVPVGTKVEAFRSVPGGAGSITTQEVENARVSSLGVGYENLKARLDDHDSNKVGVLANLNTSVKTDIVSSVNEVNTARLSDKAENASELALKATIVYVGDQITASQKVMQNYNGTLAELNADIAVDTAKNYLILDPIDTVNYGYVCYYDSALLAWVAGWLFQELGLADNSVTFDSASNELTGKILEGKNVYPKTTIVTSGKYIDNTGALITSTTLGVSDFVELIPNQYYILPTHANLSGCWFDKNRTFVSRITYTDGVLGTNANPAIFKTPSNVKYIRVNVNTVDPANVIYKDTFMIVFGKTYPTSYVAYGVDAFNVLVGEKQIKDRSITVDHFKDVLINLFDKTQLTNGYYLNSVGEYVVSVSGALGYTNPIAVKPNTVYSVPLLTGVNGGGFLDIDNTWIGYIVMISGSTTAFMTPSNASSVVLNVNILDPSSAIHKDRYMVVESDNYPSVYVPYGVEFITWLQVSSGVNSKYKDKIIDCFGDSITWYDGNVFSSNHIEAGIIAVGYPSYMRDELGAVVNNYGQSGTTFPEIMTRIKAQVYTNVSAVTITGGVNDWAELLAIGAIAPIGSEFDTTTSYGGLQSAIEYIIAQNPKTKIYLMTPIRGLFKDTSADPLAGQEFPVIYQELIKTVGKLYGLPVIDLYDLCGFNKANYADYYGDTGVVLGDRYIHVTNDGYGRMSEIIVPFMRDN